MLKRILHNNETASGLTVLGILWLVIFILVSPLNNYPLNDAWSYILAVRTFVEDGKLIMEGWMSGPIITSVLWGSIFCLPFGFSIEALKLSTLVLSLTGVIFTYLLVRKVTGRTITALAAGTIIAANPLYINLSTTFMTDVPFYAFFVTSLYLYIMYLEKRRRSYFFAASALALFSTFIRQFGIIIPLAFAIFEVISSRKSGLRYAAAHFLSFIIIGGLYYIYIRLLAAGGQETAYNNLAGIFHVGLPDLLWRIYIRTGLLLLEGGLWLSPLLAYWLWEERATIKHRWKYLLLPVILFLLPMSRVFMDWPHGNVMHDLGLGPITTRDIYIGATGVQSFANSSFFWLLRPFAVMGGVAIVVLLSINFQRLKKMFRNNDVAGVDHTDGTAVLASVLAFLYVAVLFLSHTYFDRYIIPLLVLFFLMVRPTAIQFQPSFKAKLVFTAVMAVSMLFAVMSTRFYLEWNRVRWDAASALISEGVSVSKIDGGHEFNGWYGAEILKDGSWETDEYTYVLSFSELKNYRCIKETRIDHPFMKEDVVFHVLKKISDHSEEVAVKAP